MAYQRHQLATLSDEAYEEALYEVRYNEDMDNREDDE